MHELKWINDLLALTIRDLVILALCNIIIGYLLIRAARTAMIVALRGIFADLGERVTKLENQTLNRDFLVKWKNDLMEELDHRFVNSESCFFRHATPEQVAAVLESRKRIAEESLRERRTTT